MTKSINALNNITPADFNMEVFKELTNAVVRTQKAVMAIDENYAETKAKYDAAMDNMQKALTAGNIPDVQKYAAEAKRNENKLGEDPAAKFQEFDEALNALHAFMTPKVVALAPVENGDAPEELAA